MNKKQILAYSPNIKKTKNESLSDYKCRQLDYWLKHTESKPAPIYMCWYQTALEITWNFYWAFLSKRKKDYYEYAFYRFVFSIGNRRDRTLKWK